ncbi:MAG: hypothetical protein PHX62_00065 [Bacilli bacterium]|nr:hypothetical protein [Bacilli bacterium]
MVFADNNHINRAIKEMYLKCVLLNSIYSTNIKYMDNLVKHLSSIENFEEMLKNATQISLI